MIGGRRKSRRSLIFSTQHFSTGDGSRSWLDRGIGVLRWFVPAPLPAPLVSTSFLNLEESLGKIRADRIGTRGADSFLSFGNAAANPHRPTTTARSGNLRVQPLAQGASLSHGKRGKGGDTGNGEPASLDLGEHVLHRVDGKRADVCGSRFLQQLREHYSHEFVGLIPGRNGYDAGASEIRIIEIGFDTRAARLRVVAFCKIFDQFAGTLSDEVCGAILDHSSVPIFFR